MTCQHLHISVFSMFVGEHVCESVNNAFFDLRSVGRLLCQGFHVPMLCIARGPCHSDFYKLLLDARFLITNDTLESKLRYWVGK